MIDTLLRMARRRNESAVSAEPAGATTSETGKSPVRRREAQFSDFNAILALRERWGLSKDSPENWRRLWRDNPALSLGAANFPIGWVQEANETIVGYLGSIPLLYQYGDQVVLAAATTSYAVDPAYRSRSLGMVGAFFRQPGCDLYLDTTATPAAGKIMQAFRAERLPQLDYGTVLFWVLDPHDFLHSVTKKLQLSPKLGGILATLGSPALHGDIFIRKRRPASGPLRLSCRELRIEEIGDDFQSLWLRKVHERPRLMAWRTPEILRWHFLVPHSSGRPQVLACYNGKTLAGYAIVSTTTVRELGLQKSSVADLFAADDNPETISELLAVAYELAKKNLSDVLEIMGFPESVRNIFRVSKPYSRRYPACPYFYKTDNPALRNVLVNEDSWYACPYDGDATLHA
jgi:hypothetical protein